MRSFIIVLFFSLISLVNGDEHMHAHGPLGTYHPNIEAPSPVGCNRGRGVPLSNTTLMTLNVSAIFYNSSQIINITWTPSADTCNDDFMGAYFAEIPLGQACHYFDFQFIASKQQNLASWRMINLRRPLEFRYYSRNGLCKGGYTLIGRSVVVQPFNYNEPTHIHLAFGDRIDQMYVSYLTNSSQYIPLCQYGLSPSVLSFQANGTSLTYKASDMCEGKANITGPQNFIDPGYMHTILLQDLRPSTTYYYRVGTNEHGWSGIYSFTNRPADENEGVNLIVYGDMGVAPLGRGVRSTVDRVTAKMNEINATCIVHIGDISYARGIGALWDAFMTQMQPIAAHVPYMVGIGNHEYDHLTGGEHDPSGAPLPGGFHPPWGDYGADSGGECAVPVVRRFHSPSNGLGIFWYSYNVGPVHIVMFSTEHHFEESSRQYTWLENDLKSVNRAHTPWIIVGSHRPMFSSELNGPRQSIASELQLHLEPLFYKYKVDINLFAHRHSYERSCPMYKEKCIKDGITHILIGMAGIGLDTHAHSGAAWSEYYDEQFGYTNIFANKTHLHFRYHHSSDDAIADHFMLLK